MYTPTFCARFPSAFSRTRKTASGFPRSALVGDEAFGEEEEQENGDEFSRLRGVNGVDFALTMSPDKSNAPKDVPARQGETEYELAGQGPQ